MYATPNDLKTSSETAFINHGFVQGKARVVIVTGGCGQVLARQPEVTEADVVVYVDVVDEIAAARPPLAVKVIALAPGESLATLLASVDAPQELRNYMKTHPGVLLSTGLGQIRQLGYLAARKILQDPNFTEWVNGAVFEPLLLRHNGLLVEIEIAMVSSSSGGTGSGAAQCFGEAITDFLAARTTALVHILNIRIGCLAFTGLGARTRSNTAGALPEDVNFALAPDRKDREIRELIVVEMPMDGQNNEQRDAHVAQFIQSLRTRSVRWFRERGHINMVLTSELGAISIVRPGYYQALDERVIAGETCAKVLPAVEALLATPADIEVVRDVRVVLTHDDHSVPSVDDLMNRVRHSPKGMPENFRDLCDETPSYQSKAYIVLRGDTAVAAGPDFERMVRQPCRSESDYHRLIGICKGVLKRNEDALSADTHKLATLRAPLAAAKQQVQEASDRIYPRGLRQKLSKAVSNPAGNEQQLHRAVQHARELADACRQLEATLDCRTAVSELVRSALDRICSPLRRLQPVFEDYRPVPGAHRTPLVTVAEDSLARILPRLDLCGSHRDILALLVSCVQKVTTAGLARIVNATSDDVPSIVRALISGDPPTVSPWWGGAEPTGARQAMFVLPPIPSSLEDDLRAQLQRDSGDQLQLAVAATAAGGLNVVRMEYVKPDRLSCLDTPLLATTRRQEVEPQSYLFRTPDNNGKTDRFGQLAARETGRLRVR